MEHTAAHGTRTHPRHCSIFHSIFEPLNQVWSLVCPATPQRIRRLFIDTGELDETTAAVKSHDSRKVERGLGLRYE